MSINIADEITAEYNKYIREVIDYDATNKPITRLDIGGIVSAVTFAAGYQIASNKRATRITELEAQLADAKQANQWQPIETAPKNGEPILLCVGNVIGSGRYRSLHRTISTMLNFYFDGATLPSGATHWRPRPSAPAIQAEGKQA